MEKIKSLLNPGHSKDDEVLYGDKSGARARAQSTSEPKSQSLSSHAGPTSTLENSTAGTLPTSSDPDTQYSRDAKTAEGPAALGLGSEQYNSSGVPASNTEIYGSALTHPSQKNEPTPALGDVGLSSVTPATNSAYPDSLSTAPRSTDPNAGLPSMTPATKSAYPNSPSTAQSSINPIGSPEHDSHFGRDAALASGAKASGIGAPESSKHHVHTPSTPATQPMGNDGYGTAKILGTTTTGPTVRSEASAPGSMDISSGQSLDSTATKHDGSHLGREAALVGGSGAYEAKRHHDASSTSTPIHQSTSQQLGPGAALGTGLRDMPSGSGICSSSTTRRPDATSIASNASIKSGILGNVPSSEMSKSSTDLPAASASGGSLVGGSSTSSANPTQSASQSASGDRSFPLTGGQTSGSALPSSTSHPGHDAAAAMGGLGLAGAGATEAWKRHGNSSAPESATSAASKIAAGSQARSGAWPAVTDNDAREEPAEWKDHTHGGVGHDYKGDPCDPNEDNTSSGSGLPPQGPHQTQAANLLDPAVRHDSISHMPGTFPRTESDMIVPGQTAIQSGSNIDPDRRADNIVGTHDTSSTDRHLGRDASEPHEINASIIPPSTIAASSLPAHSSTGRSTDALYSSSTAVPSTGEVASKLRDDYDSHTGRNAALGSGAGLGGYEANSHLEDRGMRPDIQPPTTASTLTSAGAPAPTDTAPGQERVASQSSNLDDKTHHSRDAAVVGVGAAGLGAYELGKHHDQKQNIMGQTPAGTNVRNDGVPLSSQKSPIPHHQKENVPAEDKHYSSRDAAAVGTVGVGADHESSKHEAEKAAKEQSKIQEKLAKEREHEAAKRHKDHEKEVKHHDKDAAKREKDAEKEKKPSLLSRILHRKKDRHGNDIDSEEEDTKHGHSKEAVGVASGVATEHDGHNKLHKDPPVGHPAHDANARSSRTYFSTDAGPTLEERAEAELAKSKYTGTTHIPTEGHRYE
ncbi:hypothetical protein FKW77_000666 [Venturia effusa]|uniref:Uncharacterized protein n=1 Tax=Venturia effusa TaxID=50376 RepID=A0A517LPD7_9PEZI|nr:hypothetical protein FKW77_000666 [Venturia effusa]